MPAPLHSAFVCKCLPPSPLRTGTLGRRWTTSKPTCTAGRAGSRGASEARLLCRQPSQLLPAGAAWSSCHHGLSLPPALLLHAVRRRATLCTVMPSACVCASGCSKTTLAQLVRGTCTSLQHSHNAIASLCLPSHLLLVPSPFTLPAAAAPPAGTTTLSPQTCAARWRPDGLHQWPCQHSGSCCHRTRRRLTRRQRLDRQPAVWRRRPLVKQQHLPPRHRSGAALQHEYAVTLISWVAVQTLFVGVARAIATMLCCGAQCATCTHLLFMQTFVVFISKQSYS